jgi:hypothetical protein
MELFTVCDTPEMMRSRSRRKTPMLGRIDSERRTRRSLPKNRFAAATS